MASSRRGSPRRCRLRIGDRVVLIVAAGTSRMDNRKVKALFGGKPKMLGLDEVAEITGHEVGGVCPFGLKTPLPVYCDVSLKAFDIVVPAAGSTHSAVKITPARMAELTKAEWVDVCERRPARKRRPIRLPHSKVSAGAAPPAAASVAARGNVALSAADHAASAHDWPAAVRHSFRTPRGNYWRAAACSAASTPRSG